MASPRERGMTGAPDSVLLEMSRMRDRAPFILALTIALVATPWLAPLPSRLAADGYFDGDEARILGLAARVAHDVRQGARAERFATGSERFDQEWAFGTMMTAAMGFGQAAILLPRHRAEMLRNMEQALDAMLSPGGRSYDAAAWGEDPLDALAHDRGHAAFLGYGGLPLGLHRLLVPHSRFAALHDRWIRAVEARIQASPTGLVETYPNERYGIDTASLYGTLGLARLAGRSRGGDITRFLQHGVDARTGLVVQSLDANGHAIDAPRGSGTALAAYTLRFHDPDLARRLDRAMVTELDTGIGGFGAMREYPRSHDGFGDIDSGPVVLGASVAATGFSLASARTFRDRARFRRMFATAWLFGAPTGRNDARGFVTGGPIGNAILFAMLTAIPAGRLPGEGR